VKNLTDLIAFNKEHADIELVEPYWSDQSLFMQSNETEQDDAFHEAVAANYKMGRDGAIDGAMKKYNLDTLIAPTTNASRPPALAGYPVLSVPLGFQPPDVVLGEADPVRMKAPNMPFGLAFLGTAYSEFDLIKYAYAFEQATKARYKQNAYPEATPQTQLVDVIEK